MDKAVKIKIIIFASLGVLVLLVVALFVSSGDKNSVPEENVNTSLRAQETADFTLDDMMKSEGEQAHPDYENFANAEPTAATYNEDAEVKALQEQLRQNQQPEAPTAAPKKTVKKKEPPEAAATVPAKRSRFFSGEEQAPTGNTIEVIVSGDQQITNGSTIKLITLQEISLSGNIKIKKGTALFGVVELKQDRITVEIQSVRINNSIYDLKKTVYDRDGLPGIYVPLNIKAEAAKEATGAAVADMNVTATGGDILSTGVNAVSSAAKSVFMRKNNQIVVTVKSNYKLYLK